jgi:tRNA(Ile)-lysidine synthase
MPRRALAAAWRRFGEPRRIGVAFSGGGDSTALLHATLWLAVRRGLTVEAIHVNHRLRPESDAEAAFCREQAAALGAPFVALDLEPQAFFGNLHQAAREARYRALAGRAAAQGLEIVLTAHTLDDQAETLLHRILRGTGPAGLAGVRERLDVFGRPWLRVRRAELRRYLDHHGLKWLDDPSNQNERFLRTRIRSELLPVLTKLAGDAALDALGRLAEIAAVEREALDELAAGDMAGCREGDGLNAARLTALPPGRRGLVLRRWLAGRGLNPSKRALSDLDRLAAAPGPRGPCRLPGGLAVARGYAALNWAAPAIVEPPWTPFDAQGPAQREFAKGRIQLSAGPASPGADEKGHRVAPAKLAGCQWRPSWPGARLRAAGLGKLVKCQDLFVNAKIPRELRPHWPLLARGDEVLLVPGVRLSEELTGDGLARTWVVRLDWL